MKPLYNQEQFNKSKTTDKLPCECYNCNKIFFKTKKDISYVLNGKKNKIGKYCNSCKNTSRKNKQKLNCSQCNKEFLKRPSEIKKSSNHFCCKSCSVTYNNTHKTTGNRRSKLEIYLEQKLIKLYPDHNILFNDKTIINSELDIYFPSLNLAFELNGIFHYEPIYGQDKLNQIHNNDNRKFQACIEKGIELCIIDTSCQKYVKDSTSKKYLDIITDIMSKNQYVKEQLQSIKMDSNHQPSPYQGDAPPIMLLMRI